MSANAQMGLFEVKTHFSEVVERVLREGRPITVTRRGIPVVDIVPTSSTGDARMTRAQALAALEELRRELPSLGFDEIREMIAEGRDRCPSS